jgi:hypothetical protein
MLLAAALVFMPSAAPAQLAVKDGDFLACTFPMPNGSDALYVADTRSGLLAVFVYDPASRSLQPKAMRRIADGFGGEQ